MYLFFSDFFAVSEEELDEYGAFNISLITDLPLFIDPFLLFGSENQEYQALHDNIIRYLRFLRKKSESRNISPANISSWYCFSEVKQNWFGFCETGNTGRGLGRGFAQALNLNLVKVFQDFGNEKITQGSHLEKLCLIRSGVGRDMISDFTTNLIKDYLLQYTATFAKNHISEDLLITVAVPRVYFDYDTERWMSKKYKLPVCNDDFVILTPKDILTKDDTWINHSDMLLNLMEIPNAIENEQLRGEINNYFYLQIPRDREPTIKDSFHAKLTTLEKYPELIDYYIKTKEGTGEEAIASSSLKVLESDQLYVKHFGNFAFLLQQYTPFYNIPGNTKEETLEKIKYFKDVIENKGGHKIFFDPKGEPLRREKDVHILFRFLWHGTPSDVSREVDDGRGPADYKISRGAKDKTLVEFKLASNTHLKRNLQKQLEIYKKASDATVGYKIILYFTEEQYIRVHGILKDLKMENDPYVILIDACFDNKPSASKA